MSSEAVQAAVAYFSSVEPPPTGVESGTEEYKRKDELAYSLSMLPMGTKRHVKIICVGAGFSGLCAAHAVESGKLTNATLTVFEKNADIGGTWFENRYPGCAYVFPISEALLCGWGYSMKTKGLVDSCDIPIHNYQFTWAPNPWFPSYYAPSADIQQYIQDVADQHKLRKYFKLSHKVIGAKWIEERQKWQVQVVQIDGREVAREDPTSHEGEIGEPWVEECDFLLNASGVVNNWKWPKIPGRESFKGTGGVIHSAAWPKNVDLKGKTVSLIGNGSTGVQILPSILDDVEKVYVHIRSRTWITVGFASKYAGADGDNVVFTEEQKRYWAEHPGEYLKYRKDVELELNSRFRSFLRESSQQKVALEYSVGEMTGKLQAKAELIESMVPDFPVGCRRPTPGNGYLEALCSEKVEIIWGEPIEFTEKGLKSASGEIYEVDTIICATGFEINFCPRFPIIGRNGVNLQEEWKKNLPAGYLGVTAANMPNYFMYIGPPGPLIHGSIVVALEFITDYMVKLITKMQVENYGSVQPKAGVPEAWLKHTLSWIKKTVWDAGCSNTYKNGTSDRPLFSIHPGSRLHFFQLLLNPRYEDFDWKSLCPDPDLRFAWLANGFTHDESYKDTLTIDKDQTYFLQPVPADAFIRKHGGEGYPQTNGVGSGAAVNGVHGAVINGLES